MMSKLKEIMELIKLLRIDVYIALFMLGYGVIQVPNVELIQDKVCINQLGNEVEVCRSLSSTDKSTDELQSKVLKLTTSIRNYQILATAIPGVIFSFFFGYWIDKYPSHIRILLVLPCFGAFIQVVTMISQCVYFEMDIMNSLWSYLAFGLGGSQSLVLAASFTYAAKKTPQKFRSIRFAIVDLFVFTAIPVSIALGGKILAAKPWFSHEERNFTGVFVTSAACMLMAIIWAIIFINDSTPLNNEHISKSTEPGERYSTVGGTTMTEVDLSDGKSAQKDKSKELSGHKKGIWAIAADILNPTNVHATMKTFLRRRSNNDRMKVILLAISVMFTFISLLAESTFGFQYTEKVFHWDYEYYSSISAFLTMAQSTGTIAGSVYLKNKLKLGDAEVAVIGSISHFLGNLFKGIESVTGYVTGSVAFCFSGITIPATRSCITHIIDYNEIGQVLSIVSSIQAVGPLMTSLITTVIFEATLDSIPGLTWHILAVLVCFSLFVQLWVSFATDSDGNDKKSSTKIRFKTGEKEIVSIEGISGPEQARKF